MKQRLSNSYLMDIATEEFTTMHYKILLVLMTGTHTQSQIAEILGVKHRQNLTTPINELTEKGYIETDHIKGRNKFLKIILNKKEVTSPNDGQLTLNEE